MLQSTGTFCGECNLRYDCSSLRTNVYTSCVNCHTRLVKQKAWFKNELGKLQIKFESTNTELYQLKATLQSRDIDLTQVQTTLDYKNKELNEIHTTLDCKNAELKDLKSKLAFLRLQFDSEQADGLLRADAEILVHDEHLDMPIHAHKIVLANRSIVFRKMFESGMMESKTGKVWIDDATLPVIRAVIRFCYHAEIDFTEEVTAEEVLAVSHKYAIHLLQEICEEHLIKTLDKANLLERLTLAKTFGAKGLRKEALEYLKSNFDDAIGGVFGEEL
ncbi:unnamed protein product [Calypogeia fissa]